VGRPVLAADAAAQAELEEAELDLVRTHPTVGVDLLGGEEDVLVRSVVRGHHERWDGAGYPKAVPARDLHPFARLAAVAEVYDAVTSPRPFRAAAPAASGHAAVLAGAGTAFDPEVVALFADVVAPTPVGTTVRLGDGRAAVVAADPLAPGGLVVRAERRGGRVEELAGAQLAPLDETARVGVGAA
jgi:HD-GYP domain-containing protein (c-di-GMP phosphodiesterase class II)